MGIRQIITSDWNGKVITGPIEPVMITIKRPGQAPEDVEPIAVYMTDEDVDALVANLENDDEYLNRNKPSGSTASAATPGTRKTSSNSELEQFKKSLEKHLFPKNVQAARSNEQKWRKSKWAEVAEAKPELETAIKGASIAELKRIAPQVSTEADREKLITILESNPSTVNALLLRIVRELMNEDVPS